jgi:hypothetical protein
MFSRAAEEHLAGLIFTFAYDRTVRSNFIEEARKAIESRGGTVSFVELRCSAEALEKRIEQPSRREFGKLSSLSRFRELKEAGAFVVPRIPGGGLVLETDGVAPAETAEQIFSRLGLEPAGPDRDA